MTAPWPSSSVADRRSLARGHASPSACSQAVGDRRDVVDARRRRIERVELAQRVGVELVRDRVDRGDDIGTPPFDDRRVHQRGDVLGGLEMSVIGQLDVVDELRIGAEQQGDIDVAVAERLVGDRSAGLEGDEVGELQPVHLTKPDLAELARGALCRTAEDELGSDRRQITERGQPVPASGVLADDERVDVLRRRRVEGGDGASGDDTLEGTVVRRRVGVGRDGTGAEERHRSPAVVGHELDQSGMQGGTDELSRAEPERPLDAEPTRPRAPGCTARRAARSRGSRTSRP